jgi:hypothetical protein
VILNFISGGPRIVGLHFKKQPFPPRRRHGVLRSREVHITRRKHYCVGGMNDSSHPYILTSRAANVSDEEKVFTIVVFCPVFVHG